MSSNTLPFAVMRLLSPSILTRSLPIAALLSSQSLSFGVVASSIPQRQFSSPSKMTEGGNQNYVAGDLTAQTSQRIQDAQDVGDLRRLCTEAHSRLPLSSSLAQSRRTRSLSEAGRQMPSSRTPLRTPLVRATRLRLIVLREQASVLTTRSSGERQYKAQWWGMPAAFSKSDLLAWHVEKDDHREIRYVRRRRACLRNGKAMLMAAQSALQVQRQRYQVKMIGTVKEMVVSGC